MRLALPVLLLAVLIAAPLPAATDECTSAVVSPAASLDHAPILWKNRDTDTLSNKVVFVRETPHAYLALVNADSASGRFVYAGLNDAGFAIMNTVAYNLPENSGELADLEGTVMADALRTCGTVADFEAYLAAHLGPDLGSRTNYGVIDGEGGAAIFETHNHGFRRLDAGAAPERYLVNTNFARTGEADAGAGYLRFERASELFAAFAPGNVDFRTILTRFTRDLGHPLLDHPAPESLRRLPAGRSSWISTRDCIDRYDTSAAVVIVGRTAAAPATMWVIPGEPVTAPAVPLWVEAGASPAPLWQGDQAPLWRESARIKGIVRPHATQRKQDYLDLARLDNAAGTGVLPAILAAEREIRDRTAAFLATTHTGAELAAFQADMAEAALAALRAIGSTSAEQPR